MNPGLPLGPITLHYYGLILGLAIIGAYYLIRLRAAKQMISLSVIDNVFLFAVPLAIIGARIYFVIFSWQQFVDNPQKIFAIWEGGLAIHGALIGGFLGLLIALSLVKKSKKSVSMGLLLDLVAPVLLLAQAVGRLGNFVNQEAFGRPTDLPWGLFIDPVKRPALYSSFERFQPTFAYEAIWNVLGAILLFWLEKKAWRKKLGRGSLFALYVIWYSAGRFLIESLRTDSLYLGSIRVAQLISAAAIVGALIFIWYRKSKQGKQKNVKSSS